MVRQEIVEGIKLAMSKGETLKQAMYSFYNAGYKKEEIEEAARTVNNSEINTVNYQKQLQQSKKEKSQESSEKTQQKKKNLGKVNSFQPHPMPKEEEQTQKKKGPTKQKVSYYGEKNYKNTFLIILVIIFISILLGLLVEIYLFREEIADFFNRFF